MRLAQQKTLWTPAQHQFLMARSVMSENEQKSETGLIGALRRRKLRCLRYPHRPRVFKKFTLHQLFACLVLKDFYNLTVSGYGGSVGGQRFAARGNRSGKSIPLHDAAEGGRSAVAEEIVLAADHEAPSSRRGRRRSSAATCHWRRWTPAVSKHATPAVTMCGGEQKMGKTSPSAPSRIAAFPSWVWPATRRVIFV